MPEPFATSEDLAAGWRDLSDEETDRADVLLARASRKIRSQRRGIDAAIAAETLDADLVSDVVCAMVKRAMSGPIDLAGISQQTQVEGPFQQSYTYANPAGDLYLTKEEKRDLRIDQQVAGSVDLIPSESSSSSSSSSS